MENMILKYFKEIIEHITTDRVNIRFHTKEATAAILPEPEQGYYYFLAQRKRG